MISPHFGATYFFNRLENNNRQKTFTGCPPGVRPMSALTVTYYEHRDDLQELYKTKAEETSRKMGIPVDAIYSCDPGDNLSEGQIMAHVAKLLKNTAKFAETRVTALQGEQ